MKSPTKVIFRKWKEVIIAIFPEIPGNKDPNTCLSYTQVGDYCACIPENIMDKTRFATPEEYADLKTELEKKFNYGLIVIKKPRSHHKKGTKSTRRV